MCYRYSLVALLLIALAGCHCCSRPCALSPSPPPCPPATCSQTPCPGPQVFQPPPGAGPVTPAPVRSF
jgi:hypothetical protein